MIAAVERRQQEHRTVRCCAHEALAVFGVAKGPILSGFRGEPLWPAGVVGSMTHCHGYYAAAVASTVDVVSLGIDAEPNQSMPDGLIATVTTPNEQSDLMRLARTHRDVAWDRVVFSAKESVYKAWYPLTGRRLDFGDCDIVLDSNRGEFVGHLHVKGPVVDGRELGSFAGQWTVLRRQEGAHILTAVTVGDRFAGTRVARFLAS